MTKKRKPSHPGEILDELYIKPLRLNLQKLADRLDISRNTLYKIRDRKAGVSPAIALALAAAFDTTPQLWLNLQQNYDLWIEEHEHTRARIAPILKGGSLLVNKQNLGIAGDLSTHTTSSAAEGRGRQRRQPRI